MGARKTSTKKNEALEQFTVVLEEIRSQFRVFGEALQSLNEKMDARFDAHDARFDAHDARFDRVDRELALVKVAVIENSREIQELRGSVASIEQKLETKVDRDEVEGIVARVIAR